MNKSLTPQDLINPLRPSGYNYVIDGNSSPAHVSGFVPQIPSRLSATGHQFQLPARPTGLEAAQVVCDYVNGNPGVRDHVPPSKGRPDGFMDASGTLHRDLPPEVTIRPALKRKRISTPERDLHIKMTPRLREVMKPGDLYEVKAGIGRAEIMTAVAQLKLGRFEKGVKGRNFMVLPERPADLHVKWIENECIILVVQS